MMVPITTTSHRSLIVRTTTTSPRPDVRLFMAGGFGGGGGSSSSKTKSKKTSKKTDDVSLKPKQQWDRYLDLKGVTKIPVAVRTRDDPEWRMVGHVRSANNNAYTDYAVARQRALIVEHAKRLYPLKITPKSIVEWGYQNTDTDEWIAVDKSIVKSTTTTTSTDETAKPLEKLIGFEGRPDPNSGYYCVYNEGRLVNGESSSSSS